MNPVLQLAIATILFGSAGGFIKFADLSPLVMTFFRSGVPLFVAINMFVARGEPIFKGTKPFLLLISFLDAIRVFCYVVGFSYADISTAVIVFYTWPLFATLFSSWFLKEKIPQRNLWLLPCFLLGILAIYADGEFSFSSRNFLGLNSILLAAILSAITAVGYKSKSQETSIPRIIFYQNFFATILAIPFLLTIRPWPNLYQSTMGISYGLSTGFLGFYCFFAALNQLKASTTAIFCYLEVLSTILFGVIIFQEQLSPNVIVGASLVLGASIFLKTKD